jgi:hypothetical protein
VEIRMSRPRCLPTLLALLFLPASGAAAAPPATAPALTLALRAGATFGNVFSRTIALHASGFDDAVRRVSGPPPTRCSTLPPTHRACASTISMTAAPRAAAR